MEELCQLFEHLYPDMRRGIWARAALYRGLSTLVTRPGMTFIDLVPLLSRTSRTQTEELWRDELIAEVTDPELARFWERFDSLSWAQQENYAAPVLDRVWQLNERPDVRNIIGQSVSSFSMREAIRQRKILLINLSGLGVETGRLAGTLLLNAIWSAVRVVRPIRPADAACCSMSSKTSCTCRSIRRACSSKPEASVWPWCWPTSIWTSSAISAAPSWPMPAARWCSRRRLTTPGCSPASSGGAWPTRTSRILGSSRCCANWQRTTGSVRR